MRCFRDPAAIHASCEDYRAAATIDLNDDDASAARGEKVTAPLLALWGEHGFVGRHYRDVLAIWQQYAVKVDGRPLPCGHLPPRGGACGDDHGSSGLLQRKKFSPNVPD